jgi:hypothetical protein
MSVDFPAVRSTLEVRNARPRKLTQNALIIGDDLKGLPDEPCSVSL